MVDLRLLLSVASACLFLASACSAGPQRENTLKSDQGEEQTKLPQPLGLKIGMTPSEADVLLLRMKASLKVRSDDKPIAGDSLKGRATFPEGGMLEKATLYFVGQRLWQMKLRPGKQIRKQIEPHLGKPDAQKDDCKIWAFQPELQGVFCCDDICRIFDMNQWLLAGVARARAEQAYSGFTAELDRTKKSSK